jgi:hypothetical protein
MVKSEYLISVFLAIICFVPLIVYIGCANDGEEEVTPSEVGSTEIEEGTTTLEIPEPVLPVKIPDDEYRGKEVFIDEETGYEYVIRELDPGNPPLVIMANDFLDDYDKWDIIADFNDIPDARKIPDFTPLKIPIGRSPDYATISALRNSVIMKRTVDPDWIAAKLRIKLTNGDGVRTLDGSEATISFGSGSKLQIGENSMVFISDLVREDKGKPKKSNLNLEEGTLTITKKGISSNEEIEITTTDAIIKPQISPIGEVIFRTKTIRDKSTLVMSYRGNVEVSAAGESVTLKSGEGSEVKRGAGPSSPKPLLPAPNIVNNEGMTYCYGDPIIKWEAVEGAVSYIVEIAYDSEFLQVFKIAKDLTDMKIHEDYLKGKYHLRVCATDKEGFDGYWSRTSSFEILNEGRDTEAPVTTFEFIGGEPFLSDRIIYLPRGCGIEFTAADDLSGIEAIYIKINGGTEKRYSGEILYLVEGEYDITYYAVDRRGRKEKANNISFVVDAKPPTTGVKASL